jgi:hypothetical protein
VYTYSHKTEFQDAAYNEFMALGAKKDLQDTQGTLWVELEGRWYDAACASKVVADHFVKNWMGLVSGLA